MGVLYTTDSTMRKFSAAEVTAVPATGTICWNGASGWVHREPGNVCIKRAQSVKGKAGMEKNVYKSYEELPLMLTVPGQQC